MNTANKLTILRILVVPLFIYFLMSGQMILAITAFAFAAFTDWVDGYVARKYNQITNFGKLIDPLADKILVIAAFVCFIELDIIPAWSVFVIIARELTVTALRSLAATEGKVIAASWWGKAKTVSQILAIIMIMVNQMHSLDIYGFTTVTYIFSICVVLTIISFIDYFKQCLPFIKFK